MEFYIITGYSVLATFIIVFLAGFIINERKRIRRIERELMKALDNIIYLNARMNDFVRMFDKKGEGKTDGNK